MPVLSSFVVHNVYKRILFSRNIKCSHDKLSYYPGRHYEYGYIVHNNYNQDVQNICQKQYWIVVNPLTNGIEFISINNELYNNPIQHDVFIV